MRKINNIISSSIAPKDADALWINPEDKTINVFDNGWVSLGNCTHEENTSNEEVAEAK